MKVLKTVISQRMINLLWHLPKAVFANIIYGFPSKKMRIVGVTGTDGKTTTVNMIYQILSEAGRGVSMLSTVNAKIGKNSYDTGFHVTTPDSFKLQKLLKMAYQDRSRVFVLEATSHALDQHRLWGINFEVGVITNVTHEHLDYHRSFNNYLKTKAKLISNTKMAVLNADDPNFEFLKTKTKGKIVSFSLKKGGGIDGREFPLKLKVPGRYNLANALAAASVGKYFLIKDSLIKKSLEKFDNLEGRMQEVKNKLGIKIIIDFAHTPNGLENAISTLREKSKKGKIISLIGAEGFRDEGKRAKMGEIATKLADIVIITSVDPRGQLNIINSQILEGVKRAGGKLKKNIFIVDDRESAIKMAIKELAKKGDTVAIFGKGHEKSMNLDGKKELPWSDTLAVERILAS